MALRIERWLGAEHGGRAGLWLDMQSAYDLWQARKGAQALLRAVRPARVEPQHDGFAALT